MSAAGAGAAVAVGAALVLLGAGGPRYRLLPAAPRRRRRRADEAVPADAVALVLDLVAAAVSAGAPPEAALRHVGDAVDGPAGDQLTAVARALALGAPPDLAWAGTSPAWDPLRRCLRLAATTGAPVAGLLREAALQVRREVRREALAAAARLSVRVVLPLGLCALPAFVLLGVAPLVIAVAQGLLGTG